MKGMADFEAVKKEKITWNHPTTKNHCQYIFIIFWHYK